MGMARLMTDHAPSRMSLTIDAPARRRPGRKMRVNLRTAAPVPGQGPAMIHLWAVDEGVLLTTAYRTPDPLGHFLAQRRLDDAVPAVLVLADGVAAVQVDVVAVVVVRRTLPAVSLRP